MRMVIDMPEIAKCPLCGNTLQMDQWKWPECTKCPFRCALSDFPSITAAMELARAEVAFDKAHDVSDDRLENAVNTMADVVLEKLHHVLEVFK